MISYTSSKMIFLNKKVDQSKTINLTIGSVIRDKSKVKLENEWSRELWETIVIYCYFVFQIPIKVTCYGAGVLNLSIQITFPLSYNPKINLICVKLLNFPAKFLKMNTFSRIIRFDLQFSQKGKLTKVNKNCY